jgi:hypothetical protein
MAGRSRKRYGNEGGGFPLGEILGLALGGGGDNPAFGAKEPGDVDFTYKGDPSKAMKKFGTTKPFKPNNLLQKFYGHDDADKANKAYALGQAEAEARVKRLPREIAAQRGAEAGAEQDKQNREDIRLALDLSKYAEAQRAQHPGELVPTLSPQEYRFRYGAHGAGSGIPVAENIAAGAEAKLPLAGRSALAEQEAAMSRDDLTSIANRQRESVLRLNPSLARTSIEEELKTGGLANMARSLDNTLSAGTLQDRISSGKAALESQRLGNAYAESTLPTRVASSAADLESQKLHNRFLEATEQSRVASEKASALGRELANKQQALENRFQDTTFLDRVAGVRLGNEGREASNKGQRFANILEEGLLPSRIAAGEEENVLRATRANQESRFLKLTPSYSSDLMGEELKSRALGNQQAERQLPFAGLYRAGDLVFTSPDLRSYVTQTPAVQGGHSSFDFNTGQQTVSKPQAAQAVTVKDGVVFRPASSGAANAVRPLTPSLSPSVQTPVFQNFEEERKQREAQQQAEFLHRILGY